MDWLKAERIGHGYQLIHDEDLFKRVKKERIHLEVSFRVYSIAYID